MPGVPATNPPRPKPPPSPESANRRLGELAVPGAGREPCRGRRVFQARSAVGQRFVTGHEHGGTTPVDESFSAELAGIKNVDRALGSADTMINDFKFAPARVQVPLTGLNVNPFKSTGANASPIDLQDDPAMQDLRERERESAVQAVQSLKLQSITHGTNKRVCMINSVRYQEGQEAGGFVVEEIASNMVVLRKGAYRFELKPSM